MPEKDEPITEDILQEADKLMGWIEKYQSVIRKLLGTRVVAYRPLLAKKVGGVKAAVMLSQLLYWGEQEMIKERDGWVYKYVDALEEETGLTKGEQANARDKLVELKVIDARLYGNPKCWHYRVNMDKLIELLVSEETSPTKSDLVGQETSPTLVRKPDIYNTILKNQRGAKNAPRGGIKVPPPKVVPLRAIPSKEQLRSLETFFWENTHLLIPVDRKAEGKMWLKPFREIFAATHGDYALTEQVIEKAIKQLRGRELTISSPNSILKVALSIAAVGPDDGRHFGVEN